ncbi:MAG: hypothetical protein HY393_00415 [Candidatus Diapherotrites archaeon]|nr:hypothetical protein [Candidatus Diapherotrites archaeon]
MQFPLIEAMLSCPSEGKTGRIGICTNTLAPVLVESEITPELKPHVSVLGSMVVNRDGAERMIINALTHPTLEYLILFGEETLSFRPSTNLLSALMNGYAPHKKGNFIQGGKGIAFQYPSISSAVLDAFRSRVRVLPLFIGDSQEHLNAYMDWLKFRVPEEVFSCVQKARQGKGIYYDVLQELLQTLARLPPTKRLPINLNPKEFHALQPPVVQVPLNAQIPKAPFNVRASASGVAADIDFGTIQTTIAGTDTFPMASAINAFMQEKNVRLSPLHELLLGAELSRAEMEWKHGISHDSFIQKASPINPSMVIPLLSNPVLKPDQKYYYKIALKAKTISVQSLAYNPDEAVFDWQSSSVFSLLECLAKENRFQEYEQGSLHRIDVGIEVGRAGIGLASGKDFLQDFRILFSPNYTHFPLVFAQGDSFLNVHQQVITKLYTEGVTMPHPDAHKGAMRSAAVLSIFRRAGKTLQEFPSFYSSGTASANDLRVQYCAELSSFEEKGAYTYGHRTRTHFGFDQLESVARALKENPSQPFIVQRFDYARDMAVQEIPVQDAQGNILRVRLQATHDPCLTHDVYFIAGNKLHAFHVARAHNMVNAYPENIFGLHDAYDQFVAHSLGLELGDMFMLSSRANVLLLTEEQKAKRIISEPVPANGVPEDSIGLFNLAKSTAFNGVAYWEGPLKEHSMPPAHPCLRVLQDYEGVNLIDRCISYLKNRGNSHNNPVMGTFNPRRPALNESNRLVFFQCNQQGGKLHATAVFLNGTPLQLNADLELCNYLATQYKDALKLPLGSLFAFFVPFQGGP